MRSLLHHPAFQALEANWRSIEHLVRELDPGQRIALLLQDVSRDELAQDLADHAADLSQSALHHHLCGPQTEPPDGQAWSLLVSDQSFTASLAELQWLASLAAMAARAAGVDRLTAPKTWQPLAPDVAAFWHDLRHSPLARWLGLALPRILTRLPYGLKSDPINAFAFEEQVPREHESYLWGSPAFSLALLAGQSFLDDGWHWTTCPVIFTAKTANHTSRLAPRSTSANRPPKPSGSTV